MQLLSHASPYDTTTTNNNNTPTTTTTTTTKNYNNNNNNNNSDLSAPTTGEVADVGQRRVDGATGRHRSSNW